MEFTLALAQCTHPADGKVEALVEGYASQAAAHSADLLVFPESLMTRYEEELESFAAAAQPLDGEYCTALNSIAARHGLWMVYTVNELNPNGRPFNTAVAVDAQGTMQSVYRKIHLFDSATTTESSRMSAGSDAPRVVETPFGKLGVGICYDLRFPEFARSLALQGCELLVYPAAWVAGELKVEQWRTLLAARAVENEVFVAGLSRCDEGYIGCSAVFDPLGRCVAQAGSEEELLTCTIDTSVRDDARTRIPVFDHRKPELYG